MMTLLQEENSRAALIHLHRMITIATHPRALARGLVT